MNPAASSPAAPGRPSAARIATALALLAGAALYLPNLRLELLADDFIYVAGARTHSLLAWLGTTAGASYYRPLSRQLYFSAMAHAWGADPLPYHVASLVLYLLAAALLAMLAARLVAPAAAALAAVFFVAQHGGSGLTGWACCTQDLLALTAGLGAMLAHLAGRRAWALALLAAALLSKETAAVVPFLIAALEWRGSRRPATAAAAIRAAGPYFLLVLAWAAAYAGVLHRMPAGPSDAPVMDVRMGAEPVLRGISLSLLALFNLEERWSLSGLAAQDGLRLAAGLALGLAAVWLATRGAGGVRSAWPAQGGVDPGSRSSRQTRGAPGGVRKAGAVAGPRLPGAVRLGVIWMGLSLLPLAVIGHRWSAYDTAMLSAGLALLLSALLVRRRVLALALAAFMLVGGPAADAAQGGAGEEGLHSLWSLARLRRLSDITRGLHRTLTGSHPTLPSGTRVVLVFVPNVSLIAFRGDQALRAWYGDTTLTLAVAPEGFDPPTSRIVVADCNEDTRPPSWHLESPEFEALADSAWRANVASHPEHEREFNEALMRHPEWLQEGSKWHAFVLARLGYDNDMTGRRDEAESFFRRSIALRPDAGSTYLLLGIHDIRWGLPEARDHLSQAVQALPQSADAAYDYAVALQTGGDSTRALEWFRRSLQLGLTGPARDAGMRYIAAQEKSLRRRAFP